MSTLPVSQSVLHSLSNLKDTIQQCLEELREKNDSLNASEHRARELEAEVADLQRRLRTACAENAELQETVRTLRRDNAKLMSFKRSIVESVNEETVSPTVSSRASATFGSSLKTPPKTSSVGPLDRADLGLDSTHFSSSSSSRFGDDLLAELDAFRERKSETPHLYSSSSSPSSTDGRKFFRKARNELSYEKFSKFLSVIKELNSRRLSREDALRAANQLFMTENPQLYSEFARLLDRLDSE
ncbi:hypothetical protein RCL1_002467 [Eukaryota sp. TZLM3-RCL]